MSNYTLHHGDCLDVLRTLPENSVHCCVTSPPYWGLRDYGTATWDGGDPACDHAVGRFTTPASEKQTSNNGSGNLQARDTCRKCGARRIDQQLGLEPTPEAYVDRMVAVFRDVRRVLREDGTCWLNLGDSYAGSGRGNNPNGKQGTNKGTQFDPDNSGFVPASLKPKDLVGIPWRVAFALQADGWWLRQDIIWHKPNPMPESVTDRCTKAHEYVFLLTKSARYFYDAQAVSEPNSENSHVTRKDNALSPIRGEYLQQPNNGGQTGLGAKDYTTGGRNRRSVWTITTKPYSGAHFATMPPDLAELCILAGSPVGGVVLDPFAGSGTTLAVAVGNGRLGVGIELNAQYHELARRRLERVQLPMLLEVA